MDVASVLGAPALTIALIRDSACERSKGASDAVPRPRKASAVGR